MLWEDINIEICKFKCYNKTSLYKGVQNNFDLKYWLNPAKSFRVDVSGSMKELNHSHFTALQVKNSIIDLANNDRNTPPKSTFISPKLPSGLIMMELVWLVI